MRLLVLLALLSGAPAMGQNVAGSTPGSFRVTESGAAEYRIPIRVPPGIAGMEPKLALVYNSQAGNGHLGMGWNIEGLSAITRCPRTWAQDGLPPVGVNYDSNDRFCLDGQRLMAVNGGAYGAVGTEYRTERESFTRVVSKDGTLGDPAWFEVRTKSGQIMEYGNTTVSRIEAQGKSAARVWALNKVSDIKGNYLTVSYVEDSANGDYYPHRIDYAGASLRFVHVGGRPDVVSQYRGGSLIRRAQSLANVQAFLGESLVRDYRLLYDNAGAVSRSRLRSLTECAGAGASCLHATTIDWQSGGSGFAPATPPWMQHGPHQTTQDHYADVNGDGKADLVHVVSDGRYLVSLSTGTSFQGGAQWMQHGPHGFNQDRFVDVNGDGRADLVHIVTDGAILVSLSTGTSFQGGALWVQHGAHDPAQDHFVDVNGDGRADLVHASMTGLYWVSLSTGTSFTAPAVWMQHAPHATNQDRLVDVNGDGMADLVHVSMNGQIWVSLSTGTSFTAPAVWLVHGPHDPAQDHLADVNGDGLADFVHVGNQGHYWVSLSTGTSFTAPAVWVQHGAHAANQDRLVDVNGDGMADLVLIGNDGRYWVSLSTGTSFTGPAVWFTHGPHDPAQDQFADVDGDGKADLLHVVTDGTYLVSRSNGPYPDLATSAATGLGAVIDITYKPLTDGSVYSKDSGASWPVQDVQAPMYVVSNFQTSDGMLGTSTTHYTYRGLRADVATGRGSLGFQWTESIHPSTSLKVRTENRQEWPYVGLPWLMMKTHIASGVVLSQVTSNYSCINPVTGAPCSIVPGNRYFPFVSQSLETSSDLTSAGTVVALPSVTTTTQYDAFGNPTSMTVSASDGHSKTTTNTFTNDAANWLIGRLTSSTVLSTSP